MPWMCYNNDKWQTKIPFFNISVDIILISEEPLATSGYSVANICVVMIQKTTFEFIVNK